MDLATTWLPALGTMLLGSFAVGAWYGDNKIHAVWYGFFGIICLFLLISLQIIDKIHAGETIAKSINTNRPEIGILSVDVENVKVGGLLKIVVQYKNSGNQTALRMQVINTWVVQSESKPQPPIPEILPETNSIALIQDNSVSAVINDKVAFSKSIYEEIRNGKILLWLVGKVEYQDHAGKKYTTPYRLKYLPDTNAFGPSGNDIDTDPT